MCILLIINYIYTLKNNSDIYITYIYSFFQLFACKLLIIISKSFLEKILIVYILYQSSVESNLTTHIERKKQNIINFYHTHTTHTHIFTFHAHLSPQQHLLHTLNSKIFYHGCSFPSNV